MNYLKQYLQEKIDDGYNKLFYGEEMYDFKTIDAINVIEDLQCLLEEKQKIIAIAIKLTLKWQLSVNCELDNYKFGEDLLKILKGENENVKN